MEKKKQSKFKVSVYRFWIEYKQFFEGESTRRMRRRAWARRLRSAADSRMGIFGMGSFDLAGI
jgi:hypothetical protein